MSTFKLIGGMALFTVLGAPMVWVLWDGLNSLLSGRPGEVRYALVLPVLLVFVGLLVVVSRSVKKWDERGVR